MFNGWVVLELDKDGYPVMKDQDDGIYLANAKLNKTQSTASGVKRIGKSGNPWYDPSTGRFANGPAGVKVLQGGQFLKNLVNSAKQQVSLLSSRVSADSISAVQGSNGQVNVTYYKNGTAVGTASYPTTDTKKDQATASEDIAPAEPVSSVPPGVDPEQWARRQDAVRTAAREFSAQKDGDIREWLQGKTSRELSEEEIQVFVEDVKMQRLSDLVDALDNSIRKGIPQLVRGRGVVRVVPPRGYIKKTLHNLDDHEIAQIHMRLRARGLSEKDLETGLINRFPEERRVQLLGLVGSNVTQEKDSQGGKTENSSGDDSGGKESS